MDSTERLKLSIDSVAEYINHTTLSQHLNDDNGYLEKSALELLINENNNQVLNARSFFESYGLSIKMTTITNQICTILKMDDAIFNHSIINDLASFILLTDFPSNVHRFWKVNQWRLIGNRSKTLIMKFDNIEHNMAYFSSCLVCVFRKMVEESSIPLNELKLKLTKFIDNIQKYVKDFDHAMWETWFLCDGKFVDWSFFIASFLMPQENYVSVHAYIEDQNRINYAVKYFTKAKYSQYILCYKKCIMNESKSQKRKFEEEEEVKKKKKKVTLTYSNVTGKKNYFIKESKERLRRLL
ncbi:Hypothetical protein CINCED_3A024154 [Cinara cedri]|uniref:Uncharacterized protein n=1 Tax=Cinara cedri TaxID=506608 RepID=A0A5E4MZI6_9HEMI|nr:Hypothetical protein CINCED_3A024154 [Cinara cedri]